MKNNQAKLSAGGFTLVEALVGIAIFVMIALGIYQAFIQSMTLVRLSRLMVTSAALSTEQFEIIHNLPYTQVGLTTGIPLGSLLATSSVTRDNADFLVETTVRTIDDPFDGTLGGAPNDLSPADYKLVEIKISLPAEPRFQPLSYVEYIAPKSLESASTNGALFVKVFDANGQPIEGANVSIANNALPTHILFSDTTNKDGILQIVDAPPSVSAYEITVSKDGYSSERTYPIDDPLNPNPEKPHATVATQQVTQTSLAIDRVSTINVQSATETCAPIGNVSFSLSGTKMIGQPDILKYEENLSTDDSGLKTIGDMEWDTYNLDLIDDVYDLAGEISPIPFSLAPGSIQDVKIIVIPKNPKSLLVTVKEAGTNLPLSGATVRLVNEEFSGQLITGRGFLRQTDWSGGSGQEDYLDQTQYFSSDGNIETADPSGEIKLTKAFDLYATDGNLTSSTFDTGSASNFFQIFYTPQDQPWQTGAESVRLQIATNKDKLTWAYLGPDGTSATYYSAADSNINTIHNNDQYLRYRIYFSTASSTFTPDVGEISFTFSSLCVPPGQVLFDGLAAEGTSTLIISKPDYETVTEDISTALPWQLKEIILMP